VGIRASKRLGEEIKSCPAGIRNLDLPACSFVTLPSAHCDCLFSNVFIYKSKVVAYTL